MYNITIDGEKKKHDSRRFLAGGKGSFDKIIQNIDKILSETNHKVRIRCNIDDDNIESIPSLLLFLQNKGWLSLERIEMIFRATTEYSTNNDYDFPIARNIISPENIVRFIEILRKQGMREANIDGTLIPPVLIGLFWSRLFEEEMIDENRRTKTIDILCSATQGFFGSLELDGTIRSCGFELAQSQGKIFPREEVIYENVKYWNSVEFILEKFLHQPCLECKFFFVCNKRQCPYNQLDQYDEKLGYCIDVEQSLDTFFRYFGKFL